MRKKAILVTSFGTSYPEALEKCIAATERAIAENFQDYQIRRAFTSEFIINKLFQRDGIKIDNVMEALTKLKQEGFQEVIVQPLHIIPGLEYEKIAAIVNKFKHDQSFDKIVLGRPLLSYTKDADDFEIAVAALKGHLPKLAPDQVTILVGHGSRHQANLCYKKLQEKLDQQGWPVLIGTVEAEPTLEQLMEILKTKQVKSIMLMPFMIVAGEHTYNDLACDDGDSWKTQLEQAGYQVDVNVRGLGESEAYRQIYIQHIRDVIG